MTSQVREENREVLTLSEKDEAAIGVMMAVKETEGGEILSWWRRGRVELPVQRKLTQDILQA